MIKNNSLNLAMYKDSGLWVIVGLIFLHLSQSVYFVSGDFARSGSLVVGVGLIAAAAIFRTRLNIGRHALFFVLSGCYFSLLGFLGLIQEHAICHNVVGQIFVLICVLLFWSGYVLARDKTFSGGSERHWSLVAVAGFSSACLLAFLQFVKQISFLGVARGYGDTALNPVGVAYAHTCLGLVFLLLGIFNKSVLRRCFFLFVAALSFFVVLSSASRGAVIWGAGAIVFFSVLTRSRWRFSVRGVVLVIAALLLVLPVIIAFYHMNYAVSERLDILIIRFSTMFESLTATGSSTADLSVYARQSMWQYYWSSFDHWFLLGEMGYAGYPHNQWLEILVSFGFLGVPLLVMSISLFFRLGYDAFRKRIFPDFETSLVLTLFVYGYLQSMTSLSLYMNRVLWLGFGYLLGMYSHRLEVTMRRKVFSVS